MGSEVAGSSEGGLTELVNSVGEEGNNGNEENEESEVSGEVDDMGPPTGSTSDVQFERLEIGEGGTMDSTVVQKLKLRQDVLGLEVLEG